MKFTSMCSICRRWAFLAVSRRARASSSWVFTPRDSLYSRENWDCRHLYSRVSFTTSSGIFRKSIWKIRRWQWSHILKKNKKLLVSKIWNGFLTVMICVTTSNLKTRDDIFTLSFSLSLTASWSSTCSFSNSAMRLLANSWLCSNSALRLSN